MHCSMITNEFGKEVVVSKVDKEIPQGYLVFWCLFT